MQPQPVDPRLLGLRDWLPGQVLRGSGDAHYHLRDRVGEGEQGWIFSASWDEPGGFEVVVKVLRPDVVTPESFARFAREAQVLRMLGQSTRPNPHVVRFFDHATARVTAPPAGEPIELPFTVLEYVRGPTLQSILARTPGTSIGLDRARRIGRQIALALQDVHARNVVHRDLKPSNVLLATDGGAEVAKVTDFGLVKVVDIGLARTTALAGATLGYAPPEQFEQGNRRVTPRTDVFSFAAVLYEMLTGTSAFPHRDGENPLVVVTRLLNGPRPSLLSTQGVLPRELGMRPDLLACLDSLIGRATAAEPDERQASIAEFWGAVEPYLRTASARPSPPAGIPVSIEEMATALDLPGPRPPVPNMGPVAPRESQAHSGSWSWRVRLPALRSAAVRSALFDPSGEAAIAVGEDGLLFWEGSGWTTPTWASTLETRALRGVAWLRTGELVVFGGRGVTARLVVGGGVEQWTVPDREVTFRGVHVDAPGMTVTLVGERPARPEGGSGDGPKSTAVIAQFVRGQLSFLSDVPACRRLRAVTRLRSGEIVACGDFGALVRVELGAARHVVSICGGHLNAIAAVDGGGAIAVGAGGHALSLSSGLRAQLEAVQTTRDLTALAVDSGGVAWAGSAHARLLRRTNGSWVRMSGELGLSSSVVALWIAPSVVAGVTPRVRQGVRPGVLRAICDDGAIVEGSVAG